MKIKDIKFAAVIGLTRPGSSGTNRFSGEKRTCRSQKFVSKGTYSDNSVELAGGGTLALWTSSVVTEVSHERTSPGQSKSPHHARSRVCPADCPLRQHHGSFRLGFERWHPGLDQARRFTFPLVLITPPTGMG